MNRSSNAMFHDGNYHKQPMYDFLFKSKINTQQK